MNNNLRWRNGQSSRLVRIVQVVSTKINYDVPRWYCLFGVLISNAMSSWNKFFVSSIHQNSVEKLSSLSPVKTLFLAIKTAPQKNLLRPVSILLSSATNLQSFCDEKFNFLVFSYQGKSPGWIASPPTISPTPWCATPHFTCIDEHFLGDRVKIRKIAKNFNILWHSVKNSAAGMAFGDFCDGLKQVFILSSSNT